MAKSYELDISGHQNLYNNYIERNLKKYSSEPDNVVNDETGILLFKSGFEGMPISMFIRK